MKKWDDIGQEDSDCIQWLKRQGKSFQLSIPVFLKMLIILHYVSQKHFQTFKSKWKSERFGLKTFLIFFWAEKPFFVLASIYTFSNFFLFKTRLIGINCLPFKLYICICIIWLSSKHLFRREGRPRNKLCFCGNKYIMQSQWNWEIEQKHVKKCKMKSWKMIKWTHYFSTGIIV